MWNEEGWTNLRETLDRFSIPYSIHKIIPFVGELIPDVTPEGPVICMGAYSMRHVAKERGWYPGVFDLEPFDFEIQKQHWSEHMLNYHAVVSRFEDANFPDGANNMFIRPIHDSKSFAGKVFDREEFYTWKRKICVLEHDYGSTIDKDTLIQLCPLQTIYSEHRFWIVKSKVVTSSTYKIGWTIHYQSVNDDRFEQYVNERIAEWQPLESFVIDVCDTSDGLKIVEINTLNSSGFYAGDMQKLVIALEDGYGVL